jgi:pimeloyl-ACP methyl ester carboxylesterase
MRGRMPSPARRYSSAGLRLFLVLALYAAQSAVCAAEIRSGTVNAADEVEIGYSVRGSGLPAIVFIHGWANDSSYWDAQLDLFASERQVVAIDLAGHGVSGGGRAIHSMQSFGGDVRSVLEALDLGDVILVGHSLGGPVAVEAALAMPGRVRGLVGVDTLQRLSLDLGGEQIDGFLAPFRADFFRSTAAWVARMFPAEADSALRHEIVADMALSDPRIGVDALEELLLWLSNDCEGALSHLRVPLHAINSDRVPTDGEALAAALPGYQLHQISGVGHFPMREDPETFNALLARVLALLDTPPRGE